MAKHPHPARQIQWRAADSSNIQAVGWDNEDNMYVLFKHGGLYMYKDVTRQRVVAASRAESVGKYVNEEIIKHFTAIKIA